MGRFAIGGIETSSIKELHQWQQQRIKAGEGGGECGPYVQGSQSGTRGTEEDDEGPVKSKVLQVW